MGRYRGVLYSIFHLEDSWCMLGNLICSETAMKQWQRLQSSTMEQQRLQPDFLKSRAEWCLGECVSIAQGSLAACCRLLDATVMQRKAAAERKEREINMGKNKWPGNGEMRRKAKWLRRKKCETNHSSLGLWAEAHSIASVCFFPWVTHGCIFYLQ